MADVTTSGEDLRDTVRGRYAGAARTGKSPTDGASCCASGFQTEHGEVFGAGLYGIDDVDGVPESAVELSLGCGNPTAVATITEGQTVLDLGSGAGTDLLVTAKRVGPTGTVYGLDMTDEMLAVAQANVAKAGVRNVHLLKGFIEDVPLPRASVDVVISNCVINLSGDKPTVLKEAARVLRPRGLFAVSDVIADDDMSDETRADMLAYTGCIAGALTHSEFVDGLTAAGLVDIELQETHRVHDAAVAAIVRARKPEADCCDREACCEPEAKADCCGDGPDASSCGCRN